MSFVGSAHVVLIPSYNAGARLFETIAEVRSRALPVIVVIDGSTDGSGEAAAVMAQSDPDLTVAALPRNRGKGGAILHGLLLARNQGFTHALTMDADGQHSAAHIAPMIDLSRADPEAMILGAPIFDETAPRVRILGHAIANFWTRLATGGGGIADSLFGFRVYPIEKLIEAFAATSGMRRFDFDSEAAIRLYRAGVRPINLATPVRYFRSAEGGVSHFRYPRDNWLLIRMYVRLFAALLLRPRDNAARFRPPRPISSRPRTRDAA